jgi:hypothetical protein
MPGNLNDAKSSASSSKRPKPSTKRTAQPGGINRESSIDRPLEGTGFDIPRDVSGFRICYICYDEEGERICQRDSLSIGRGRPAGDRAAAGG